MFKMLDLGRILVFWISRMCGFCVYLGFLVIVIYLDGEFRFLDLGFSVKKVIIKVIIYCLVL